ncbi:Nucleolar protein 6 [Harpegnathos saltator]|uniref:Nucleolar protein 6 n=1 Tax=Harpegnathos saltator TaxID=610380 RepID=E2BPS7_HARSA|nr:Nucleolar protein 6 [Harpegnathos saltator]
MDFYKTALNKKKHDEYNVDYEEEEDPDNKEEKEEDLDYGEEENLDNEEEREDLDYEEDLDNYEIESFALNQKKRKKVTNEISDVAPKKKKFENHLYKQPTVEELQQHKETEDSYHSNLFKLQIEEILSTVKLEDKYKILFDTWFEKLKKTIKSIDETEEIPLVDNNLEDKLGIHIPVPHVPEETKSVFKFLTPSHIDVIGSYNSGCTLGPNVIVDVMVEMPAASFGKQDFQNYIYFRKKAMYLAFITSNIGSDIAESKKFIGDDLRSYLKLRPNGKLNKKIDIIIHISAQETSFHLDRFLPEKNSVRPKWYFDKSSSDETLPSTPYYNSLILHDLVMRNTNDNVAQIIRQHENLRDAIILLKIWLKQRELSNNCDGFTGHIMTMFVIYLLRTKKLDQSMTSCQIVRITWSCLVRRNWCEEGITMCKDKKNQEQISHYHSYYDCVFLDITGYHNYTVQLSKCTFSWVQREAELSLKHLNNKHMDIFQALFMQNVPFYRAFDQVLCFQDSTILEKLVNNKSSMNDKINYGPNKRSQMIKLLVEILQKGLGNRINRLCVLPNPFKEWECTEDIPSDAGKLIIGFEFNPDTAFNILDKGPEGNLAETKLKISKNQYLFFVDQLDDFLKLHKYKITHFAYGTGEEATLKVLKAFNNLEQSLMSLSDMPLTINGVQGSSPVFRYTEVFPPLATIHRSSNGVTEEDKNCFVLAKNIKRCPAYVHANEVVLQLSVSGKWPIELEAIRRTKAAFHLQIAECLRKQHQLKVQANPSYVDVMQDGFIFRLRVAIQKEIALVKQIKADGVIKYRDNEESIELENKLFHLPQLSSALHGLYSQQPSFGPACCLAKRWLSANLMDDAHIPNTVVELLIASIYLTPAPYKPSQTPQVAFLRFLEFIAKAPWDTDPIIVNFNDEMTNEEIYAVETLFITARSSLPPLFISTPYHQQKSLWTKKAPSQLILRRINVLAKESLKIFDDLFLKDMVLDAKRMFRPSLLEYDCLIYLKSTMNPRRLQAIDIPDDVDVVDLHPYKSHSLQKIPIVDFDPVQCFLRDLRDGYGEYALFFHDTYGGSIIGVLLKPSALERKQFKVSEVNCRKLDDDDNLVLNISAMIEDFYTLGKGIVCSIDIPRNRVSSTSQ